MLIPLLSVAALLCAIVLSMWSRLNVGLLALAFAYGLGVFGAQMSIRQVMAGFPVPLFLTVLSLTLLFGHAQQNGTLGRVAGYAVQLARGRPGLLPPIFFLLALSLGTVGAGNIGAVAMLAPVAMAVAHEAGIPSFLMALLVACGGNAASLSPLAPTGVIASDLMGRIGLFGYGWSNYAQCLLAHTTVAMAGYLLFGGGKLLFTEPTPQQRERLDELLLSQQKPLQTKHAVTLFLLFAVLLTVSIAKIEIGAVALAAAVLLSVLRVSDEEQVLRELPWGTMLMVCGMTCLMGILERTGGIDLFTWLIEKLSTQRRAPFVIGFCTGLLSAYSSSSGVVLPAFLPILPKLIQMLGGGDLVALANSVNVGAHLVDVSPLSTLGALCLANAQGDDGKLYRQLLAWGLSMAVVGALYCQLVFGVLRLGSH
ncbi:MAG TPA: SLC13 family permease [Pseudomonadota bacterium]|nr:SLC13 family permease [Pseudomonadota bacterium]HNK46037.1 SLC13 family permease [Pseudomonadota bacterium]HNN53694.1 SLC13 family permease [Pseudomonadota bacterium]